MSSDLDFPVCIFRYPTEQNHHQWELVEQLYAWLEVDQDVSYPNEVGRIDASIIVCRVESNPADDDQVGSRAPVYRAASGKICVATGLIFVALNEGFTIEDCQSDLNKAGFEIQKRSPAGGVWLGHQSGSIQAALSCYSALAEFKELQSVEPQLLMQRAARNSRRSR